MAGMARRSKAKGSDLRTRMIERRLRAWLRDHLVGADVDDLMDRIRPHVLAAARDGQDDAGTVLGRALAAPALKELATVLRQALVDHAATGTGRGEGKG